MSMIRISEEIFLEASSYGKVYRRTPPKQIEFWAKIGKIAEDNPDLTYNDIKGILFSLAEKKTGED